MCLISMEVYQLRANIDTHRRWVAGYLHMVVVRSRLNVTITDGCVCVHVFMYVCEMCRMSALVIDFQINIDESSYRRPRRRSCCVLAVVVVALRKNQLKVFRRKYIIECAECRVNKFNIKYSFIGIERERAGYMYINING